MDRAEAIKVLKRLSDRKKMADQCDQASADDISLYHALDAGIAALREQEQSKPLTLEELKKTEGEVWICYPQEVFGPIHPWEDNISCSRYKFSFNSYGKTWLAYRKPPEEGAD